VSLLASTLARAMEDQQVTQLSSPTTGAEGIVAMVSRSRLQQVLVLGKDSGAELERLHSISTLLAAAGYAPILVKEHEDIPELSNEEKVRVFADHSRFVVLENSFPAGQIAEIKMCSNNRIITAAMRERGQGSSYMVTDYSNDYDFIKEFEYEMTSDSLCVAINLAVAWAEEQIKRRINYYNNLYPWRTAK